MGAAPAPAPAKPGAAPAPAPAKPGAAAPAAPAKPGAAPAPAAAKPGAAPAKPAAAAAPPAGQAKPEAPDTVPEMTQNAADAPDLKPHVTVDPPTEMLFKADQTNQAKVVIKNVHDKKIMFKIKLSDNVYFQVNQAFGTLEPGKTVTVILTHKKSPPKEGKLVVMNTLFTGNEKEIAAQFKTLTKPTGKNVNVKWIAK
uniref:Major sperm protein n=1 Tax=Caenorhabditis japonica TaxID=281687 RepID=A0A8R1EHJ2_CAEJA